MSNNEDLRKAVVKMAIANVKIDKPRWKPKDPFLRDMDYWVKGLLTINEVTENIQDRMTMEQAKWRRKNKRKVSITFKL